MSTPQNPYGQDPQGPNGGNPQAPYGQNPAPSHGQDPEQASPYAPPTPAYDPTSASQDGTQYGQQAPSYGQDSDFSAQANPYGSQSGSYGSQGDPYSTQADPYGGQASPYGGQADPYGSQASPYGSQGSSYGSAGSQGSSEHFAPSYAQGSAVGSQNPPQFTPSGSGGPNYAASPYSTPGNDSSKNWMGIVALIGGIAGFVSGGVLGLAGIIFGFLGLSAANKGEANNKGFSITGIVLGFLTVLGWIAAWILIFILIFASASAVDEGRRAAGQSDPGAGSTAPAQPGDPAATDDTSGSSGSSASQSNAVQLASGVTMKISVISSTASNTAAPTTVRNQQTAVVTMRITNSSNSSFTAGYPLTTCAVNGTRCQQYFDSSGTSLTTLPSELRQPIAAGSTKTLRFGYGPVPKSQLDRLQLTYDFSSSGVDTKRKVVFSVS